MIRLIALLLASSINLYVHSSEPAVLKKTASSSSSSNSAAAAVAHPQTSKSQLPLELSYEYLWFPEPLPFSLHRSRIARATSNLNLVIEKREEGGLLKQELSFDFDATKFSHIQSVALHENRLVLLLKKIEPCPPFTKYEMIFFRNDGNAWSEHLSFNPNYIYAYNADIQLYGNLVLVKTSGYQSAKLLIFKQEDNTLTHIETKDGINAASMHGDILAVVGNGYNRMDPSLTVYHNPSSTLLTMKAPSPATALAIDNDFVILASGYYDERDIIISTFSYNELIQLHTFKAPAPIKSLSIDNDNLIVVTKNGCIYIYNLLPLRHALLIAKSCMTASLRATYKNGPAIIL